MSSRIYLDSCIFIAYTYEKDKRHNLMKQAIQNMEKLDVEVFSSEWALAELVKSLIKDYGYLKDIALGIMNDYKQKKKIGNVEIKWVGIDTIRKYDNFDQFFEHLRTQLLEAKDLHIADAIHSLIMFNNGIPYILTTDKNDFNAVETVTAIQPEAVLALKPK